MKINIILLFIFLCFSLYPQFSCADVKDKRVSVIILKGKYSITTNQAKKVFRSAKQFYTPIDVNLIAVRMRKINDPCKRIPNTLDSGLQKFACLKIHFIQRRDLYPGDHKHYFVLPPMIQNGVSWQGGYSSGICIHGRGFSMGNAIAKRIPTGEDRLFAAAVVLGHELGHQYGCNHYDSIINLMHSNAGYYAVNGYASQMTFANQSINRMLHCNSRNHRAFRHKDFEHLQMTPIEPSLYSRYHIFS